MREDLLDRRSVRDRRQQAQAAAAVGASENIDGECAAQKFGPRVVAPAHVGAVRPRCRRW